MHPPQPTDEPVLGVDIGATRVKLGRVESDGTLSQSAVHWLTDPERDEGGILACLNALVSEVDPEGACSHVGVGVPGAVRWPDGLVTQSPNFPAWCQFGLKAALEAQLGLRVRVDNDANTGVLGAVREQGLTGHASLVGFTLGTGVGGALILGGKLYRGQSGMAGELGHITVDPDGPPCGCGSRGCLEMYASRVGLRAYVVERSLEGLDPDDPRLPERLAERARSGDSPAMEAFHRAGRALGQVIGGLANTLNMEAVLLTGGLVPTYELMEASLIAELEYRSYPAVHESLKIYVSKGTEAAGIVGAAQLWAP